MCEGVSVMCVRVYDYASGCKQKVHIKMYNYIYLLHNFKLQKKSVIFLHKRYLGNKPDYGN